LKSRKFVDSTILYALGGRGGNGCASFRREKCVPRGGPDGGDGGRGGHVILRGNHDEDSLVSISFAPHRRAQNGGAGRGKRQHGKNGRDMTVQVPCGTEVRDALTGEMLGDIVDDGQELVVAKGGKGGLGNCHWKTSVKQAPVEHTDGEPGQEASLKLDLKLLADLGLVGYPNAGKSSLLTAITHAHPKVAAYPFTTLNPIVGTLIFEDYTRMRIADVPGLISGAHEGVGLGHSFLRHIERARFLAYVVDVAGVDGRDPAGDYRSLRDELAMHRADLAERPCLVLANKMDLPGSAEALATFSAETGTDPIPISALTGQGLDRLKDALHALVRPGRDEDG